MCIDLHTTQSTYFTLVVKRPKKSNFLVNVSVSKIILFLSYVIIMMMVIVPESPPAALKCAKNRIFITRYTEKCRLVFS